MRIHTDNAETYILKLANSLACDPASLDRWYCFHIKMSTPEEHGQCFDAETTLDCLKAGYKDLECDIICCKDHDMLLLGKTTDTVSIMEIAKQLVGALQEKNIIGEIHGYDLFRDWRTIRRLLLSKTEERPIDVSSGDAAQFNGVEALHDVFMTMRKQRKERQPTHILLVEDDAVTRRLVSAVVKDNYALITAKDAQEAISNYLLYAPEIVFLDINLPDHNGFAVLKQITSHDPDAYVIMFSGNHYLDNVTHALNAGASGFVAKPFHKERLCRYIQDGELHHRKALH